MTDEVAPLLLEFKVLHTLAISSTDADLGPGHVRYYFTDDGLVTVSQVESLRYLGIGYAEITDKGLGQLRDLPNLRYLVLSYCWNVTDEGIADFRKARPDVRLEVITGPPPPEEDDVFPTD